MTPAFGSGRCGRDRRPHDPPVLDRL